MRNINKLIVSIIIACIITVIPNNKVVSNANTTLPYKEVDNVKSINIVELAKLIGDRVMEINHPLYGEGVQVDINGKLVHIYEESPYIFIDGRTTPLKTEPVVDSITGEAFDYPLPQIAEKDGDGYLIPMTVVEKFMGIKGSEEGIVIEKVKEEVDKNESSNNNNSTNNSGSSNSSSSSNTGSSNTGSSNNSSTNNNGSSNSGSSGNTESSNTGSSNNSSTNNSGNSNSGSSGNTESSNTGSSNNNSTNNNGSSNSDSSSSGGSTQKPTPEVKPELTPTPEVKPEPTPEPSKPVATGISFSNLAGRLAGMGFNSSGDFLETDGGYSGIVKATNSNVMIALQRNTPNFANTIKNIFNLLLPTQGSKLYSIVTNPCSNQTLQMDGRTVLIEVFPQGVFLTITE